MKKTILSLLCAIVTLNMMAQDAEPVKLWNWSGMVGVNASATGLWNWAAGGNNNITGVAYGKVRCLYQNDEKNISWDTNLDLEYGLTYIDQDYDQFQKSSDHIIFNTKFGWAFAPKWFLTASAAFQSQFDLGRSYTGDIQFDPIVSKFLAPSYTDISLGIDWKPNSIFSVYLSPVAGRITTAYVSDRINQKYGSEYSLGLDDNDGLRQELKEKNGVWRYTKSASGEAYTKDYSRNARAELGLTLKGSINYTYKDLKIITSVNIYTPYQWDKTKLYTVSIGAAGDNQAFYTEEQLANLPEAMRNSAEYYGYRDNNRRFGNFDVDWDFAISYHFLKCLNVTLSTSLKYYNGVKIEKFDKQTKTSLGSAERVQFMGVLGLGVGYSF